MLIGKGRTPVMKMRIEIWSKRKILPQEVAMGETVYDVYRFQISYNEVHVIIVNLSPMLYSANEIGCAVVEPKEPVIRS